jgi:hypothetical protein
MRRFWKRDRSLSELEVELRTRRSDPPADFVRTLATRVRGTERRARMKFKMSPAYGVAILAVVLLIAAGGVGVVQSASSGASHLFGRLSSSKSPETLVANGSGPNQYKQKCGRPPRRHRCVITIHGTTVKEPPAACHARAVFPVMLATATNQTMSVKYKTKNGTAKTGDGDYKARRGTVTFKPGTKLKHIKVRVCADSGKKTEYFFVKLFQPSAGATIGGKNPVKGTITQ